MLHETTRKWICRGLFIACCLAPTLLVIGAIGYAHRPWRTAAANQNLTGKLHANVSVGETWQPRPGVTEYRSIQLRDLRTDALLLAADRVRLDERSGGQTFRVDQVTLPKTEMAALVRLLEAWLGPPERAGIQLQIDRLVCPVPQGSISPGSDPHVPDPHVPGSQGSASQGSASQGSGSLQANRSFILENLQIHGVPPAADSQGPPFYRLKAQAEYRSNGQSATLRLPLRLMVDRQFVENRPHWLVTLDLGQGKKGQPGLPGWMLQRLLPGGLNFQQARFRGVIRLETDLRHVHGTLRGQVAGFRLQHFLPGDSRHQWSGEARIDWDHLSWQDGRVEEAQGLLHATHGKASRSLIADAVKLLYCRLAAQLDNAPMVEFDELACRFQLQATGLTLWGQCQLAAPGAANQMSTSPAALSGCLLARGGKPLLLQSKYMVPTAQLVRLATTPTHGWTLPATRAAQRLAQVLPLPPAAEADRGQRK